MNPKYIWPAVLATVAMSGFTLIHFLSAAVVVAPTAGGNPNDYINISFDPTIFSKTEISGGEIFNATLKVTRKIKQPVMWWC